MPQQSKPSFILMCQAEHTQACANNTAVYLIFYQRFDLYKDVLINYRM